MRFRRRPSPPPDPEADESVWARPDEGQEGETVEGAVAGAAEAPDEPAYEMVAEPEPEPEPADEPAYEMVAEPAGEAQESPRQAEPEPAGALYDVPDHEAPPPEVPEEEPPAEPAPEEPPAPVTSWTRGRGTPPRAEGTVRAAGGVVWSRWQSGLRVLLVHRPRYDDWSLPKGKAGPGESDVECALREVREETGLACSVGDELGMTTYHDRHGRLKTVRYFAMQTQGGGEGPQSEVDEIRWVALDEARRLLTYQRDAGVLDALVAMAAGQEPEEPSG